MKLSNFVLNETKGTSALNWQFFAEVDVETGFLLWKKTDRKRITRKYAGHWFFVDSGEYTPGYQAEKLANSWQAKTGQDC